MLQDLLIPWDDPGPARAGPGWESSGLALARTNPTVPRVARTNPAWDQRGLAIWDGQMDTQTKCIKVILG